MAVTKKTHKRTGGRKITSARRSSSKAKMSSMPRWVYTLIVVSVSAFSLILIYTFFFRPYFYRFRPCYGQKHFEICLPLGYAVFGIDISHHQGKIDWKKLKESSTTSTPISFVYIKATEGSDFTDPHFKKNFAEAKRQGFLRGAYHYFSPYSSGLAQAQMFIETAGIETGDLPPMIDVEEKPKEKEKFLQELKIFISKIEEHYGAKPIIYTYRKYKKKHLTDTFFKRYPSWVAHYYVEELDPDMEWIIWQCSDIGEVPGISKEVDINVFNGSIEQLHSLIIK